MSALLEPSAPTPAVSRFESIEPSALKPAAARAEPIKSSAAKPADARLASIDILRGLIMIVMALDHTRDYFGPGVNNPRDVAEPALFLTRWVTHFCAPNFIFLAGISAFLFGAKAGKVRDVSWFLLTRGLWLIFVEITIVHIAWSFSMGPGLYTFQVIFIIGASMVCLAGLIFLPRWGLVAFGLAVIAGHNLLNDATLAQAGIVWNLLHKPASIQIASGITLRILYTLIPWVGVIACGYALGPLFLRDPATRARYLSRLGAGLVIGFIVLRATNLYGDPDRWIVGSNWLSTALSFINCEKYPASLLYLAMTIGPALLLLAAFERGYARGPWAERIATFGRVPFAYYVVHLFLIHTLTIAYALAVGINTDFMVGTWPFVKPPGYGMGLLGIYCVWFIVILTLYPFCRWFSTVKSRRRDWWLKYL